MTPATQLTLSRLLLGPLVAVVLVQRTATALWVGTALFALAALTDALDGALARRMRSVTSFGRELDPIADKVLVVAAYVALHALGIAAVQTWMVVAIFAREVLITVLRAVAGRRGIVIRPSRLGKWKTAVQMSVAQLLLLTLCVRALGDPSPAHWLELGGVPGVLAVVALYAVTSLTLLSGLDYVVRNRGVLRARRPGRETA